MKIGGRAQNNIGERISTYKKIRNANANSHSPAATIAAPNAVKISLHALLHETLLPAPDASLGLAGPAHDLIRADAFRRQQDDLGSPRVLLRSIAVFDDGLKLLAISG